MLRITATVTLLFAASAHSFVRSLSHYDYGFDANGNRTSHSQSADSRSTPARGIDGSGAVQRTQPPAGEVSADDEEQGFTRTVVLPSLRPTYREVNTALAELGLQLRLGYCGTSASLLRGMYPLHVGGIVPREPERDRPFSLV